MPLYLALITKMLNEQFVIGAYIFCQPFEPIVFVQAWLSSVLVYHNYSYITRSLNSGKKILMYNML